ncbi:zinc transporter ZIP6-like isoform X2 [Saccostrea cucullata]|uniref:zinc transporter ZIP6-like isoform X2 n=1 Tax=Saccostrea cuccullata TaxID=36930 RepID=UPI002ECFD026
MGKSRNKMRRANTSPEAAKMCLPGGSKLCIVCLVLYMSTWRPIIGGNPFQDDVAEKGNLIPKNGSEESLYSSVRNDHLETHAHNDMQIQTDHSKIHAQGQYFYEKLIEKYGENGSLTLEGLQKIFQNIGIDTSESTAKKGADEHDENHEHHEDHEHHDHEHHDNHEHNEDNELHDNHDHENHEDHEHGSEAQKDRPKRSLKKKLKLKQRLIRRKRSSKTVSDSMCIKNPEHLIQLYSNNKSLVLSRPDLSDVCAGILVMLDKSSCWNDSSLPKTEACDNHDDHDHAEPHVVEASYTLENIPATVWGYSILATFIISLVGLLGVAVIPIMQKVFYNHLLQFLVALAVGALSGDALLHLVPHAFSGETHQHGSHGSEAEESRTGVLKGLVGLLAVYFFFIMERLVTILTNSKRKQKKKKHQEHKVHFTNNGDALSPGTPTEPDCGSTMLRIHPTGKALENYAVEFHKEECNLLNENATDDQNNVEAKLAGHSEEEETHDKVLDFSHGHSHSRCNTVPQTVSAIAWMVILGDGIHNFSDGLAVGAAFSNSITGGISTSIAVFCHELPHEIGDFAVLLRAGMTVKQAIIYNCVSSVLGFFGMIIGVLIGNIGTATLWIFAAIGGIFLYIAFVDMLPELTSLGTRKGENPFFHLFLQICGLITGSGIMFLIAIFEHELMNLIEP